MQRLYTGTFTPFLIKSGSSTFWIDEQAYRSQVIEATPGVKGIIEAEIDGVIYEEITELIIKTMYTNIDCDVCEDCGNFKYGRQLDANQIQRIPEFLAYIKWCTLKLREDSTLPFVMEVILCHVSTIRFLLGTSTGALDINRNTKTSYFDSENEFYRSGYLVEIPDSVLPASGYINSYTGIIVGHSSDLNITSVEGSIERYTDLINDIIRLNVDRT